MSYIKIYFITIACVGFGCGDYSSSSGSGGSYVASDICPAVSSTGKTVLCTTYRCSNDACYYCDSGQTCSGEDSLFCSDAGKCLTSTGGTSSGGTSSGGGTRTQCLLNCSTCSVSGYSYGALFKNYPVSCNQCSTYIKYCTGASIYGGAIYHCASSQCK